MKSSISSFELHHLIEEIKIVAGGKINKIFEPEKKNLILDLHIPSIGKKMIKIVAGKYLCFTTEKQDMEEPSSFCKYLRKQLNNAKIANIRQIGSERIVEILIETFEENKAVKKIIYLEFFGKGNIVLCDENSNILNLAEIQKFNDRIVMKGEKYIVPKSKYNYFEIKKEDLKNIFGYSATTTVKTLATDLGLGGTFAEEICLRAEIDKNKNGNEINEKEIEKIQRALTSILSDKNSPEIIYKNDTIFDVFPIEMRTMSNPEEFVNEKTTTFSEAIEKFFKTRESAKKEDSRLISYNDRLKRLSAIIEVQQTGLSENRKAAEDNINKGNKIYEHYSTIENLIKYFKDMWNLDFNEINEKSKENKIIKKVTKDGKIILKLD